MGGLASDWGISDRLFSACLPWGWDLGCQDRREGELVSPDWAGEGEIISSKMAGRPNYSLFFWIGIINPEGQVLWWARVSGTHGASRLAVVRSGGVLGLAFPASTRPVGDRGSQAGRL